MWPELTLHGLVLPAVCELSIGSKFKSPKKHTVLIDVLQADEVTETLKKTNVPLRPIHVRQDGLLVMRL